MRCFEIWLKRAGDTGSLEWPEVGRLVGCVA